MDARMKTQINETIWNLVRRHKKENPSAVAFVAPNAAPLTYGGLFETLDRLRFRLNSMGYGRGDRIVTLGNNDNANAALVLGVACGATAVPLNPALSAEEFAGHFRNLKVQALAVDSSLNTRARDAACDMALPIMEVDSIDNQVSGLIDIRSDGANGTRPREEVAEPDDVAMVLLTSGTGSQKAKIVPVTHRELTKRAQRIAGSLALTQNDRCLNLMPLFHGHGLSGTLNVVVYSGGSLASIDAFALDKFYEALNTLSPTWYTGSYTFQHSIHASISARRPEIEKTRLRFIRTASGRLDSRVAKNLETAFRAPVIEIYSSSETSTICSTPLPPRHRKPGTVGVRVARDVEIMNAEGKILPTGMRGQVVVRTDDVFSGYEDDPTANSEAFFDGWYCTGDEGIFDGDGYLTITGRIGDVINRGGEKISPAEIDDLLVRHPDIDVAVTFPLPHPTLGEDVAAAVVPAKGSVLSDEIVARYLRGKIASFKVPRRILLVDAVPVSATGKIVRRELAKAFGIVGDRQSPSASGDARPATVLEARLQKIWAEVLRVDDVGLDQDFFLLGGDSLQAVELFLRIERETGRRLARSTLLTDGTISKMAHTIEAGVSTSCLVPIQPKGDRPPFFCIHDGNAQVLNYRELAHLVGDQQPFYGIQALGLDGVEEPFTRIEDMAAYYIREIKKVQPTGPYYIGGYSFGGRVAFVMAQQLRLDGEEVAFLGLFDVYSRAGRSKVELNEWLHHHWQRIKDLQPREIPGYLGLRAGNFFKTQYMKARLKSYSAAWHLFKSQGRPLPRILRRPVAANDMIRRSYRPQTYDGDATLFKAELYAWAHPDQHDGWHRLIKGKLDVRQISGRHYEIVKPPHVQTLARELADALNKAYSTSMMRSVEPDSRSGDARAAN